MYCIWHHLIIYLTKYSFSKLDHSWLCLTLFDTIWAWYLVSSESFVLQSIRHHRSQSYLKSSKDLQKLVSVRCLCFYPLKFFVPIRWNSLCWRLTWNVYAFLLLRLGPSISCSRRLLYLYDHKQPLRYTGTGPKVDIYNKMFCSHLHGGSLGLGLKTRAKQNETKTKTKQR